MGKCAHPPSLVCRSLFQFGYWHTSIVQILAAHTHPQRQFLSRWPARKMGAPVTSSDATRNITLACIGGRRVHQPPHFSAGRRHRRRRQHSCCCLPSHPARSGGHLAAGGVCGLEDAAPRALQLRLLGAGRPSGCRATTRAGCRRGALPSRGHRPRLQVSNVTELLPGKYTQLLLH